MQSGRVSDRKEELLYLTFVFPVQHAKQSKTNERSIRLFVHAHTHTHMGDNFPRETERRRKKKLQNLGQIVTVYLKKICIDIGKKKKKRE